jgi:hypothetical protein
MATLVVLEEEMRLAQLARLFGGGVIGVSAGRFFESGGIF